MSKVAESFWLELGKAAARGLVEAFASGMGAHLADRLGSKKAKDVSEDETE